MADMNFKCLTWPKPLSRTLASWKKKKKKKTVKGHKHKKIEDLQNEVQLCGSLKWPSSSILKNAPRLTPFTNQILFIWCLTYLVAELMRKTSQAMLTCCITIPLDYEASCNTLSQSALSPLDPQLNPSLLCTSPTGETELFCMQDNQSIALKFQIIPDSCHPAPVQSHHQSITNQCANRC